MKQVAMISQPLRSAHCHAYLRDTNGDQVILTSDPSTFDRYEFSPRVRIMEVTPPPQLLPSRHLARARRYRLLVERSRRGSSIGRRLETIAKSLVQRLRRLNMLGIAHPSNETRSIDLAELRTSAMYARLEVEHDAGPIDRIVVFDVFDLPVALEFAEEHDVDVLVR